MYTGKITALKKAKTVWISPVFNSQLIQKSVKPLILLGLTLCAYLRKSSISILYVPYPLYIFHISHHPSSSGQIAGRLYSIRYSLLVNLPVSYGKSFPRMRGVQAYNEQNFKYFYVILRIYVCTRINT